MVLAGFIKFCYRNYVRQHRYLLDLVVIVIFSIVFGGFLTTDQLGETLWLVFPIFGLIMNISTAMLTFFLEKGNTLYFLLSKPGGRKYFFLSKIIVIVSIDLFWVATFALLYGLRFPSVEYFSLLPIRLLLITITLTLSTVLISIAYTFKPQFIWLIFGAFIFGNIINKIPLISELAISKAYNVLIVALPAFFELHYLTITLDFSGLHLFFLIVAILQIVLVYFLSRQKMLRKDFV